MIIQPVKLKHKDVFLKYARKYCINEALFNNALFGYEIRGVDTVTAKAFVDIFISEKIPCFSMIDENNIANMILIAPSAQLNYVLKKITKEVKRDFIKELATTIDNYFNYRDKSIKIAEKEFSLSRSYVMGILNVTPDSFSDGGKYFYMDAALNRAIDMIDKGADIIDIGGESTRPGAEEVSEEEELARVIPVIKNIKIERPDSVISIDTTKSVVAEKALAAGASIVNDISGLTFDEKIIDVVKEAAATLVLMHIKGTPRNMQIDPHYDYIIAEIYNFLYYQAEKAKNAGIENIIVDPGIGFGKSVADNYEILRRLGEFKGLGYPILMGLSKKSFLGKSLGLDVDDRSNATIAAETVSVMKGAFIVRTHDVAKAVEAKKILEFIHNPECVVNV